jgi:hypothetical protein
VPRAYDDEGAYEGKNDRKGTYKEKKMRKKGPTKVKMKGIDQGWATLFVSRATLATYLVYAGQYQ